MKKITIKSLHIENFKGVKLLDVAFGNKTKIKGQNASGKTTIFDAFTWLLFNKNSAGEEKFNVRPLDANGNRIDNVEIKVIATLEVNGKEVELSKVQKQKWVKRRGSDVAELQGNENIFEVDGYPKSEKDYKTYISSLVDEDLFKMLTNPQYFANMKWKEQREILMRFVSDVSDLELAKGNSEFLDLLDELEKAPSTDDISKKFTKALSEWKKKQAEIPVRIDELSKTLVQIDTSELELAKSDLENRIAKNDRRIANSGFLVSALRHEEMNLQFELSAIMQTMNEELRNKRSDLSKELYEVKTESDNCSRLISIKESEVSTNNSSIDSAEKKRAELGEQYKTESAKTFDETPYLFYENEWKFDENSTVCRSCGQTLPTDKIEQIKADFEQRKENARFSATNRLAIAREKFESENKSLLEKIKSDGFAQKNLIEDLKSKNEKLLAEIEGLKKKSAELNLKKNDLEKQLSEIPSEADYTQNKKYAELKSKQDEIKSQIESTKSSNDAVFNAEKAELQEQLDNVKAEIAKGSKNIETEERIVELENEQREVAQKVADQEKMLYLLEQFIKFKMLRISETINSKFKTVSWTLFKEQLNGGMRECCECTVNGVPHSTLNSGHRIVAGLDIIQSLSELYGVNAVIFVDNAESLNEFNLPNMDNQIVLLSVSDDKELKVESEE